MARLEALAISLSIDWSCTFTIISLCLAILYSLLLFLCLFYSCRLLRLPCYKRQSQRVFLALVALQCILRALYFFLWPLLMANNSTHCAISVEGEHEGVIMLITGSLPSALLLSAFTINAFTFARIYHTTLNHSVLKYRLVLLAMASVNVVTYTALALLYLASFARSTSSLSDTAEVLYLYALSCSFFLIAASFSYYGIKLWLGVRAPSMRNKDTSSPSFSSNEHYPQLHNGGAATHSFGHNTPFLTPSSSFASTTYTPNTTSSSSALLSCCSCNRATSSYHPMLKLAIISTLCFLCFVVRVVLLPLLSHYTSGEFSFPLLLLYVCLSEVLPLLLVLYLFDPVREGKNVLRSEGMRGGGFNVDDSDDYWRVDDDGEYGAPTTAIAVSGTAEQHYWDRGGGLSPRSGSLLSSGSSQVGTPLPPSSYVDLSLPSSLPASLSSVGSRDNTHLMLPTLSPRELDRRRAKTGMSYETAFKQDLKSLLDDD